MSESCVDLDKLLEQFNSWQLHVNEITKKNRALKDEVDGLKKLLETSQGRQAKLQKDNEELRSHVEELQKILHKRCDFEDQNRKLHKEKDSLKEELFSLQKTSEEAAVSHEKELKALSEIHLDQLKSRENELKKQGTDESEKLQEEIEKRNMTISELKQNLIEAEKEKDADLMKLRLEYDSKLLKLQKKNNKSQQMNTSQSGQEIFRKKLQHTREEYEKELATLKKTVEDLSQQLKANKQAFARNHGFDNNLSLSKKRKT